MLHTDVKYIGLVSTRLNLFKKRNDYLYNFRCIYCGDSTKNKLKTRGYFYRKKDSMLYHCHNCNATHNMRDFLRDFDSVLSREYNLEIYTEKNPKQIMEHKKPIFNIDLNVKQHKIISLLPNIDSLPFEHYAYKYVRNRMIDPRHYPRIKFTTCFKTLVDEFTPNDKKYPPNEPRIIFPYYDNKNNILGFQGRALTESSVKYITIKANLDSLKIYGLDRLDSAKTIHVVEGPIDSLFLDNGIASMDSKLDKINPILPTGTERIYIYDNEKMNKATVSNMESTINAGHKIFIWPKTIKVKDINDLYKEVGIELSEIIKKNTYEGLQAKLEFNRWL